MCQPLTESESPPTRDKKVPVRKLVHCVQMSGQNVIRRNMQEMYEGEFDTTHVASQPDPRESGESAQCLSAESMSAA